MRIQWIVAACAVAMMAASLANASTIDFETQAAASGSTFTGTPSEVNIGIASFSGGELLNNVAGLGADATGVYASEGIFGSEDNPIEITFSAPVSAFSILLVNADNTQNYTVSDNLGDSVTKSVASAGALGTATFTLAGAGLTTVDITSANAFSWSFAIDNVAFTPVATPEPRVIWLLAACVLICIVVRQRRAHSL